MTLDLDRRSSTPLLGVAALLLFVLVLVAGYALAAGNGGGGGVVDPLLAPKVSSTDLEGLTAAAVPSSTAGVAGVTREPVVTGEAGTSPPTTTTPTPLSDSTVTSTTVVEVAPAPEGLTEPDDGAVLVEHPPVTVIDTTPDPGPSPSPEPQPQPEPEPVPAPAPSVEPEPEPEEKPEVVVGDVDTDVECAIIFPDLTAERDHCQSLVERCGVYDLRCGEPGGLDHTCNQVHLRLSTEYLISAVIIVSALDDQGHSIGEIDRVDVFDTPDPVAELEAATATYCATTTTDTTSTSSTGQGNP